MMKWLDFFHRWTGGLLGLVLAILGLTGAILVHKEEWISLPHAEDALVTDGAQVSDVAGTLLANPEAQGIIFASDRLGLHQVRTGKGAGFYTDQAGQEVTRWASQWERPELWLFDLHHHLFTGDAGEWVIAAAGIAAMFFVLSGSILWWRTRKTFKFRLLPKRMSRPAIVMHHRDLGVVMAPLLFLSALTGTMMVAKPVAALVVAPFSSPKEVEATLKPPKVKGGELAKDFDWKAAVLTAHQRFPDAKIRILSKPRKPGDLVMIRMKREAEWLPNGRSALYFDGATGRLVEARDALAMPTGAQVFNMAYPVHAAKVGGLGYRVVMTLSGLAMTLLGSLAVWSFWFRRNPKKKPVAAAPIIPTSAAQG